MKKLLIVLFLVVLALPVCGQRDVMGYGKFDLELGFENPIAAAHIPGMTNHITFPFLYIEGRWQLENQPIDVGFRFGYSPVQRNDGGKYYYKALPLMAVADWQFGRGKKVNPYVGLGAGVSMNSVGYNGYASPDFAVLPRVGVRFFRFMNLSASYLLTRKEYSRLYANLGFYF
ncbi:MAG: hypothetical protein LBV38_00990 [Alistipes sp.]|jgi:opacity protein-like surface antigen|nr:hypothetical protein [Alistipes sp.]